MRLLGVYLSCRGVERAGGGPAEAILQMGGLLHIVFILDGFEGHHVVERSQFITLTSNGCIYHVLHYLEDL